MLLFSYRKNTGTLLVSSRSFFLYVCCYDFVLGGKFSIGYKTTFIFTKFINQKIVAKDSNASCNGAPYTLMHIEHNPVLHCVYLMTQQKSLLNSDLHTVAILTPLAIERVIWPAS